MNHEHLPCTLTNHVRRFAATIGVDGMSVLLEADTIENLLALAEAWRRRDAKVKQEQMYRDCMIPTNVLRTIVGGES